MKSCGVARLENFLWTRLGFPGGVVVKNPPASGSNPGDLGLIPALGISSLQLLSHVRLFATHGLQHSRLPCFSPTPGAYSNSCSLSQWCHSAIWSSVVPFSRLQSSPASESFPQSQFFASGGQSIGVSASASSPSNVYSEMLSFRIDWLALPAVQKTLKSLLQHHSSKALILQHSAFFIYNSHICAWLLEKP